MRNGVRGHLGRVSSMASSAFLASAAGTRELQDRILHRMSSANYDIFDSCLLSHAYNGMQPPDVSNFHKQKKWDKADIDAELIQSSCKNHSGRVQRHAQINGQLVR